MKIESVLITAALFIGGLASGAPAGDQPADLSAAEIIKQSQEKYASLTSYQDEGTTVATLGTLTASSFTFTINLARTNLYQIVWRQAGEYFLPKGAVWSAGDGDFLWMGKGFEPKKSAAMETALAGATGISGGAAATVPGTFFNSNRGNQLSATSSNSTRKADEKIGDVDCYVLSHGTGGRTNILWIGKADRLIHQVEHDTSAASLKAMLEEQAKKTPQIRAMLEASGGEMFKDSRAVETHQNIRINPPLTKVDFDFKPPPPAKP
jgi:outer membrane lipoprotein-sorting protein